ncbi:hypothetical protein VaNZ11_013892 [Volvox africanus]|uniref:Uncharacterized protein n=1 Tax=Volvox africanus TaxID=51714 RepID=A0ABQ5SIK9_9CHLO|nr:hypothetical protein VaNZ11_013892 [Volvox africanus]
MELEDEFSLDEARETLFTLQRACERRAVALAKIVEVLNSKEPEDEWLLEVLEEAEKGMAFHHQQLEMFTTFHSRSTAYVEAVRNEANQLAMQELMGGSGRPDEVDDGGIDSPAVAGTPGISGGQRRRSSKIVHPELLKFKLEKQAKILGKYGGIPALGAGLVLPKFQRDAILKATGSAAAREIHYSKVENKDATNLAEVMRFKVRKADDGINGGTPAPSPWQAELSAKKGKVALDGTDQKDLVTPSTRTHTVYAEELGGVLQQRQAALEQAIAAQSRPTPTATGPVISGDAEDELVEKLKRRQSAAKQAEEAEAAAAVAAAAAAAEAAAAAAPPATPAWSNPAAPFGGELTAALLRRTEQQRQQQQAASSSTPGPAADGLTEAPAGVAGGLDGTEDVKKVCPATAARGARLQATPTPGTQGQPPPLQAPAASSTSSAAQPATPAVATGFVTPVSAVARSRAVPPRTIGVAMVTPPATAAGSGCGAPAGEGAANELQEKLRRRLSALETQTPPPTI